jgi:hypothetical protein
MLLHIRQESPVFTFKIMLALDLFSRYFLGLLTHLLISVPDHVFELRLAIQAGKDVIFLLGIHVLHLHFLQNGNLFKDCGALEGSGLWLVDLRKQTRLGQTGRREVVALIVSHCSILVPNCFFRFLFRLLALLFECSQIDDLSTFHLAMEPLQPS